MNYIIFKKAGFKNETNLVEFAKREIPINLSFIDAKSLNEKVSLITKHLSFGNPGSYEKKYYGIFYDIVKDPNFKSEWPNLKASNGDHLVFWIVERHAISVTPKNVKWLHYIGRSMENLKESLPPNSPPSGSRTPPCSKMPRP